MQGRDQHSLTTTSSLYSSPRGRSRPARCTILATWVWPCPLLFDKITGTAVSMSHCLLHFVRREIVLLWAWPGYKLGAIDGVACCFASHHTSQSAFPSWTFPSWICSPAKHSLGVLEFVQGYHCTSCSIELFTQSAVLTLSRRSRSPVLLWPISDAYGHTIHTIQARIRLDLRRMEGRLSMGDPERNTLV